MKILRVKLGLRATFGRKAKKVLEKSTQGPWSYYTLDTTGGEMMNKYYMYKRCATKDGAKTRHCSKVQIHFILTSDHRQVTSLYTIF